MKKIIIRNSPSIICPVTNRVRLVEQCEKCDAFKGFHKTKAKGPAIPTAVKCEG